MSRDIFPRDKVTFRGWTTVDGDVVVIVEP